MTGKYVAPRLSSATGSSFTCPKCQTLAQQAVLNLGVVIRDVNRHVRHIANWQCSSREVTLGDEKHQTELYQTVCSICGYRMIWRVPSSSSKITKTTDDGENRPKLVVGGLKLNPFILAQIIYPVVSALPPCNIDAPEKSVRLYNEAAAVLPHSKRAAAALIRVAMETLLQEVFKTGDKIFKIIEDHQADLGDFYATAHALRLIGNDGAHPIPEAIDLDDDVTDIVESLFILFNELTEEMVSRKKRHKAAMDKIAAKSGKTIPGVATTVEADEAKPESTGLTTTSGNVS